MAQCYETTRLERRGIWKSTVSRTCFTDRRTKLHLAARCSDRCRLLAECILQPGLKEPCKNQQALEYLKSDKGGVQNIARSRIAAHYRSHIERIKSARSGLAKLQSRGLILPHQAGVVRVRKMQAR